MKMWDIISIRGMWDKGSKGCAVQHKLKKNLSKKASEVYKLCSSTTLDTYMLSSSVYPLLYWASPDPVELFWLQCLCLSLRLRSRSISSASSTLL